MFPRPVAAEGLLYRTSCLVRSLLAIDCKIKSPSPVAQPEEPTSETPVPITPPQQGSAPGESGSAAGPTQQLGGNTGPGVVLPALIEVNSDSLAPLPDVGSVETPGADQKVLARYIAMNTPTIHSRAAVLSAVSYDDGIPIKATPRGWVILGVVWYWWLLLTGVVISGIAILVKRGVFKKILSIAR